MCLKRHHEAGANKATRAAACQGALGLALRKAKQTALAAARKSSKGPGCRRRGVRSSATGDAGLANAHPGAVHAHCPSLAFMGERYRRAEFEAVLGRWNPQSKTPAVFSLTICPEFLSFLCVSRQRRAHFTHSHEGTWGARRAHGSSALCFCRPRRKMPPTSLLVGSVL